MIFEQIVWRDLGCASYLVGCQECAKAVIVDPPLEVDLVLAACDRLEARLIGIIETHTHADHVSGHGLLTGLTDAWIAVHESAGVAYEHRALRDGDTIDIGAIRLTVVHTPGHRPEHCSLLVADRSRSDEPWMALTGDSLFVGDVARPDLAIAGTEGAAALHASLRDRLLTLADGVEVFPGHVAGSLCGKGMSSRTSTTLGFERAQQPDARADGRRRIRTPRERPARRTAAERRAHRRAQSRAAAARIAAAAPRP